MSDAAAGEHDQTRVLVTGGGGFLGQYVVEQHLARGDRVRSFSRQKYPELEQLGIEQVTGDLRDPAAVRRAVADVELVQHTAAIAGIGGRWRDYYEINTLGTRHLLAACREAGVGRLVYTSSPSVTFAGGDQKGVDESAPYPRRWNCHYPRSKALAEADVLAAHRPGELATCALRPHLIWGPRDQHLIPRLLDRARRGKLKRVGDGSNLVDIVYVENAAHAQLLAGDALSREAGEPPRPNPAAGGGAAIADGRGLGVGGQAFFISQGVPVNCWEWIDQVLALGGLPPVKRGVPFAVAWTGGALLEGLFRLSGRREEPIMTRFLAAQLAHSHWFRLDRARRELGYEPLISTEEGMRRLGDWIAASGRSI